MATRTQKRSHSGAQTPCPHCGKKLSGTKGLAMHIADAHAADTAAQHAVEGIPTADHPYGLEHQVQP